MSIHSVFSIQLNKARVLPSSPHISDARRFSFEELFAIVGTLWGGDCMVARGAEFLRLNLNAVNVCRIPFSPVTATSLRGACSLRDPFIVPKPF
jgi:hypothetical protein